MSSPGSCVIDKQGKIQSVHVGYRPDIEKTLQGELDALLEGKDLAVEAAAKAKKLSEAEMQAAMAKAKNEDKLLVMNFTGSDWCIWCKRLEGEVFSEQSLNNTRVRSW